MFAISLLAITKALNVFKHVRFSNDLQKKLFSEYEHVNGVHGHYISPSKLNSALRRRGMPELPIVKPQFLAACSMSFLKGSKTSFSCYSAMKIKNFALYTLEDSSVPFIEIRLDRDTILCIYERKRPKKSNIIEAVKMMELLRKTEVENLDYVVIPEIDFKMIEKCDWVRGITSGFKELNHVICYSRLSLSSRENTIHYKSNFHYTVKSPFMFYVKKKGIKTPILMGYMNRGSWIERR